MVGQLPQPAERHLELPAVECLVAAEVPVAPLTRDTECAAVHALAADTDAAQLLAVVPVRRIPAGADPLAAAVVLFVLLLQDPAEHLLDLRRTEPGRFHELFDHLGHQLRVFEPLEKVLGENILDRLLALLRDVSEVLQKQPVEQVELRLALHEHRPAKCIKALQAVFMQIFPERREQRHPLREGDVQPAGPEVIEKR